MARVAAGVRVITQGGEPWFVAKDVAKALGYAEPHKAVDKHCNHAKLLKQDDLSRFNDSSELQIGPRGAYIIPESDLYRLIMRSNLPSAASRGLWPRTWQRLWVWKAKQRCK